MSDIEVRLECAKMAAQLCDGPNAIRTAREIYEWVTGSSSEVEEPSADQ